MTDEKTLNALVRLKNDNDFVLFEEWLQSRYDEYIEEILLTSEEPRLHLLRGKAGELKDILIAIKSAKYCLEQMKVSGQEGPEVMKAFT